MSRSDRWVRRSLLPVLTAALALLGAACAGSDKDKPSTAEDFYKQGEKVLEGSSRLFVFKSVDYPAAIAAFQEVITNFPFSEYATLAELKVADSYFAQTRFEEAASFYQDFIELHPTHPQVPYALLRNGECAYEQMLEPDQDQAKTKAAIEQFDVLIERHAGSDQIARARELRGLALDRLALHEVQIGDFYFGSETYHAAVPRYQDALQKAPEHPGYQNTKARLGISLRRMGQRKEGTRVLEAMNAEGVDGDLLDEIEAELGKPLPDAPGKSSGFSLWPFGGDDDEAPAAEPSEAAPAAPETPALQAGDGAALPTDAPESSRRWFWPF